MLSYLGLTLCCLYKLSSISIFDVLIISRTNCITFVSHFFMRLAFKTSQSLLWNFRWLDTCSYFTGSVLFLSIFQLLSFLIIFWMRNAYIWYFAMWQFWRFIDDVEVWVYIISLWILPLNCPLGIKGWRWST